MNADLLKKYGITFNIVFNSSLGKSVRASQINPTTINFLICNFLSENPIDILRDEILVDLNSALKNQSVDPEPWGLETFLVIENPNCTFFAVNSVISPTTIPTQDISAIFQAWVDWIGDNNLEYLFD